MRIVLGGEHHLRALRQSLRGHKVSACRHEGTDADAYACATAEPSRAYMVAQAIAATHEVVLGTVLARATGWASFA